MKDYFKGGKKQSATAPKGLLEMRKRGPEICFEMEEKKRRRELSHRPSTEKSQKPTSAY